MAINEAKGIERLKTNAFQSDEYAFPGKARKLMLLTNVANIDIPTTQAGSFLPPVVNCSDVLFFRKKLAPNSTFPKVSTKNTMRSTGEKFIIDFIIRMTGCKTCCPD